MRRGVRHPGDSERPKPFRKIRGQKDKMSPTDADLTHSTGGLSGSGSRTGRWKWGPELCRQVSSCGRMGQESWKRVAAAAAEVGKERREEPPIQVNQKLERPATQRGSRGACERGSLEHKSVFSSQVMPLASR